MSFDKSKNIKQNYQYFLWKEYQILTFKTHRKEKAEFSYDEISSE